ncbi:MAG: hypothetical protein AB8G16_19920 [Gammaproteobacteria bacterium]
MNNKEIDEIIECLPKGKTPFYYHKDRYALLLLKLATEGIVTKRDISGGRFGQLLSKRVVKDVLGLCGDGKISAEHFDALWPLRYECYFLTLGRWGSRSRTWDQTSRAGQNLVLQLNFSSEHDDPYRKLVDPEDERPFEYSGHPIARPPLHTLAWSRLDIDLDSGVALIEEIQNDWVRKALWRRRWVTGYLTDKAPSEERLKARRFLMYLESVLKRHTAMWDEAMLSATIWFLREELGIRRIFYHTHESGSVFKSIICGKPPRSIYTVLPRKFCFIQTDERPEFLQEKRKTRAARQRVANARFFEMSF